MRKDYDEDDYEDFEEIEPRHSVREQRSSYREASQSSQALNETTVKYMIRDIVHEILHEYVTRDDLYKYVDKRIDESLKSSRRHVVEDEDEEEYEEDDGYEEEPLDESTQHIVESKKKQFNMHSDDSINSLFGGSAPAMTKQPQTFDEAITAIGGSDQDWVASAAFGGSDTN